MPVEEIYEGSSNMEETELTPAQQAAQEYADAINEFYYSLDIDTDGEVDRLVKLEAELTNKFADFLFGVNTYSSSNKALVLGREQVGA